MIFAIYCTNLILHTHIFKIKTMPNICSTYCFCDNPYYYHHENNTNDDDDNKTNRSMKYEPSKMFGLINCEHKGFVGFEFDDYPEDVLFDMGKLPSFAPNGTFI